MLEEVEALSVELKHYIQEDNWRFEQEIEEWEEEQSCKIPQMDSSSSSASQEFSSSQGTRWEQPSTPVLPSPTTGHLHTSLCSGLT